MHQPISGAPVAYAARQANTVNEDSSPLLASCVNVDLWVFTAFAGIILCPKPHNTHAHDWLSEFRGTLLPSGVNLLMLPRR